MGGLIVRQARLDDLEEILCLWVQMVRYHTERDPRLQMRTDDVGLESMRAHVANSVERPERGLFVAQRAGQERLAGYILVHKLTSPPVALHDAFGHVSDICVDDRFRRQGVGRRLFEAAQAWCRQQRLPLIRLRVAVSNPGSRGFWKAMGARDLMYRMQIELE